MSGVTIQGAAGAFVSCTCMSRWWPMFEAMCKKRGLPIPRVTQGSYRPVSSYSAATHVGGGVVDFVTEGDWDETDALAETMGGADFVRPAIVNLWRKHCHLILTGCPHLHSSAQDQVEDWMNLRSGLASNLPDTDRTRPPTWRTYAEGIEWARRQLAAPTPTAPSPEEDDMQLSDRIPNPWKGLPGRPADDPDTITVQAALRAGARYPVVGVQSVAALARVMAVFIAAEKGADAELSSQVAAVADSLDALSAHLGNGSEVTA